MSHRLKRKKRRGWLTVANDAKMPSQIKMGKNLMDITGLSPEVIKDGTYFGVGWRVNSNCYSLSRCKNPRFPSKYLKLLNKTTNNNNNKMGTWTWKNHRGMWSMMGLRNLSKDAGQLAKAICLVLTWWSKATSLLSLPGWSVRIIFAASGELSFRQMLRLRQGSSKASKQWLL